MRQSTEKNQEKPFNSVQVVRRLAAAEGYLEIGLPTYALSELSLVGDPGPFEPIVQLFRGEALQAQEKFAEAIAPLNRAAQMFSAPLNQRALIALSDCYRHEGHEILADRAAAAAIPPNPPVGSTTKTGFPDPIFHVATKPQNRISMP